MDDRRRRGVFCTAVAAVCLTVAGLAHLVHGSALVVQFTGGR